jgi:hypothetical protein
MASPKKKATAKPSVKFKDLKSKKNPKGGSFQYHPPATTVKQGTL